MKKYFRIFIAIVYILVLSLTVRAQKVSPKPVAAGEQAVQVAAVNEIPKISGTDSKNAKSVQSAKPVLPLGEVITGDQNSTNAETKPAEQLIPAKPVEGLKVSPPPINMDRPKLSTIQPPKPIIQQQNAELK